MGQYYYIPDPGEQIGNYTPPVMDRLAQLRKNQQVNGQTVQTSTSAAAPPTPPQNSGVIWVSGKEEADKALAAAKALFGAGGQDENMPTTVLTEADFTDGAIGIMDLMIKTGLAPSKSEARRLIQGGGVVAGEEKVTDVNQKFSADAIRQGLVLRKGKKVFHKVML